MFHGLSKLLSNHVLEHLHFFIISIKPNFHWGSPSSLSSLYKPVKCLGDPWQQLLSLRCLLGKSCCVKAKSSSCSGGIDIPGGAECKCGRTIFPTALLVFGKHSHPSIPSSSQPWRWDPIKCPCKAASSGKLLWAPQNGILSDKPQPASSGVWDPAKPSLCSSGEGPGCQGHIHNQGTLLLVYSSPFQGTHLALFPAVFSRNIPSYSPLTTPGWSLGQFCVLASKQSFCGLGVGAAVTFFLTPALLKLS